MDLKEKILFVIGNDFSQRAKAIDAFKKNIFRGDSALSGLFIFSALDLDPEKLKEAAFTLTLSGEKLLIIKDVDRLGQPEREFLKENLAAMAASGYLLFESAQGLDFFRGKKDKSGLFALLLQKARVLRAKDTPGPVNIDDFSLCLRRNDLSGALYAADTIFEDKSAAGLVPLMLGMLAGRAAYTRDAARKRKLLDFVWQADRGIKEKGFDPRVTIEALLVKMFKL